MKRTMFFILISLGLVLRIHSIDPAHAAPSKQSVTVSNSFGDPADAYLEFTLSGADFVETSANMYEGDYAGGPITLSGKAIVTRPESISSWVSVRAHIGAETEAIWPPPGEDGKVEGTTLEFPFNLSYTPPPDYPLDWIAGGANLTVCGEVNCGTYEINFQVTIPEGAVAPSSTGTCHPVISNLDNLKPGDILSPAASYVDEQGNDVGIIGEAWFINGVQTSSITWDGTETTLELQFTCLDHRGYSETYVIPAYGEGGFTQPGQPGSPGLKLPGGLGALGIIGVVVAAGVAALASAVVIIKALTNASKQPPAPQQRRPRAPQTPRPGTSQPRQPQPHTPTPQPPRMKSPAQPPPGSGIFKEYADEADKLVDAIDQVRNILGKTGIREQFQEKINEKLGDYKQKLDTISEIANKPGEYAQKLQEIRDIVKEIDQEYRDIQNIFVQAHKDTQDLPPGYREGLGDLQAVIEGMGKGTSKAVQKLPGFRHIDVNHWFQMDQSFRQAAKGFGKAIRATKTSEIEAARSDQAGDTVPGYTGRSAEDWREIERIRREERRKRERNLAEQPESTFQKIWRQILGKAKPGVEKYR